MTGQLPIGLLARNEGALDKRGHLHLRFCQRSEFTFNLGFPLNSFVQLRQGIARSRAHTENFPIDFATTLLNSSLVCCLDLAIQPHSSSRAVNLDFQKTSAVWSAVLKDTSCILFRQGVVLPARFELRPPLLSSLLT